MEQLVALLNLEDVISSGPKAIAVAMIEHNFSSKVYSCAH
jgi:hypothetical protein